MPPATILYGDREVPLHRRDWVAGPQIPYRKTYALKPGQSWWEAGETPHQSERYVLQDDGTQIPVGALIAHEFIAQGADCAFFTELWHGVVFLTPDLLCVEPPPRIQSFLAAMKEALGSLRGLPDALGCFPDGRIRLHEAKNAGARDRLQPSQHRFAIVAHSLFGEQVEFGVTEWG